MKRMLLSATAVGIGLVGVASADAVSGVRSAEETRAMKRAVDFWHNVFTPLKLDQFKDYIAVDYIEHYPGLQGGLEGMLGFFRPIAKESPHGMPLVEPILKIVDGDITLFLVPRGGSPGKENLRVEIQRWKNGKQTEHWDGDAIAAQPAALEVHARTAQEQRNLDLVVNFWHGVLEPLKTDEFPQHITADYIEHDAGIPPGGLKALQEFSAGMRKQNPNGLSRTTFVHALVDGDLVALTHVKDAGPDPKDPSKRQQILGVDILRVRNGKVVEHWGDTRAAPTQSSS